MVDRSLLGPEHWFCRPFFGLFLCTQGEGRDRIDSGHPSLRRSICVFFKASFKGGDRSIPLKGPFALFSPKWSVAGRLQKALVEQSQMYNSARKVLEWLIASQLTGTHVRDEEGVKEVNKCEAKKSYVHLLWTAALFMLLGWVWGGGEEVDLWLRLHFGRCGEPR